MMPSAPCGGTMQDWPNYIQDHQKRFVQELLEFVRIPSVSASSDYTTAVVDAANWVAARLGKAGAEKCGREAADVHVRAIGRPRPRGARGSDSPVAVADRTHPSEFTGQLVRAVKDEYPFPMPIEKETR